MIKKLPFDLERAKGGAIIINRLGEKVTLEDRISHAKKWPIVIRHPGEGVLTHTINGIWHVSLGETDNDVFLLGSNSKYNTKHKIIRNIGE